MNFHPCDLTNRTTNGSYTVYEPFQVISNTREEQDQLPRSQVLIDTNENEN